MNSSHKLDFSEINSGPQWNDYCSSGNEHYVSLSHSAVCLLDCAECFFFLNYLSVSEFYSLLLSTTISMQLSNGAQYEVWIFFSSFTLRLQIRVEVGAFVCDRQVETLLWNAAYLWSVPN